MDPYMAADAQGHQQIRLVAPVAMMDHEGRPLATTTAAEAVALQNPLPQSADKAQRMMAPVVTRAAAAESSQRDPLAARTKEGQLNWLPSSFD